MMEAETVSSSEADEKCSSPTKVTKRKRLSNGTSEHDSSASTEKKETSKSPVAENGVCNGVSEMDGMVNEDDDTPADKKRRKNSKQKKEDEDVAQESETLDKSGSSEMSDSLENNGEISSHENQENDDCENKENNETSPLSNSHDSDDVDKNGKLSEDGEGEKDEDEQDCDVKGTDIDESTSEVEKVSEDTPDKMKTDSSRICNSSDNCDSENLKAAETSDANGDTKESQSDDESDKKSKDAADSEKENKDETSPTDAAEEAASRKSDPPHSDSKEEEKTGKRSERADSAADDVEIIGETKLAPAVQLQNIAQMSKNVLLVNPGIPNSLASIPISYPGTSASLLASSTMPSSVLVQSLTTSAQSFQGLSSGYIAPGMTAFPPGFVITTQGSQNVSMLAPTVAPPKPKSSLDQIELIRWEIQNRINTRPKYFKPNPTSELGPLAKFLFDIGSDLIKESVYHDLVKIQSKKNDDDKLTDKEREDLEKLKEIEKDLYATIGHLKLKLKKKCKACHFQTESDNVMYLHKQFPHEDNKIMRCAHCSFFTKQAMAFKFHMEAEHNCQPKLHDKKAFYECDMCPYENNQEQKLILHKQRCLKQFRPLFNLHPSCLSGAEINLCLENIFYKPVVPKNLKLLQQKHAQQQAALAEARRQQAHMQALAAQKNAAAIAAKKQQQQQQLQKRQPLPIAPRYVTPPAGRMPFPTKGGQQQAVRYNSAANSKGPRPTVANILNSKQNSALPANSAAVGFEVCEICGGYVKDRKALRIHFFYAHRIDLPFNLFERNQAPLYCATCYVRFWTAQGLRKHIDTHKEENQTRGIVGKCISCGHHVLNLLLHMRIVHNRELQHYVNALMCMFCGGHFGTRQECEQHIVKAHGKVDPVTGALKSPPGQAAQQQSPKGMSNSKKAANNSLVKGSVCVLCNLNFGRNVDLTRHCMRMHHTCMKCGMVVIDKASLMKHTCLSSPSGTRDCTMCGETGFHPAYYVKHLRDKHLRKFSIQVAKLSKSVVEKWTKRPYPFKEKVEVLVEISDSEDEDDDIPLNKLKSPAVEASPGKKPRIGPACKIGRRSETAQKAESADVVSVDDEDEDRSSDSKESSKDSKEKKPEVDGDSKEVIDLDSTRDASSEDEDSKSSESPRSRKRKPTSDSPVSERSSKRRKSSS